VDDENLEFALSDDGVAPLHSPSGHRASVITHGAARDHEGINGADADLLVGMRSGKTGAVSAFYLRFRPVLLDQAYKLGVRPSEREEVVTEFLGDIAIALIEATTPPRSLAAYVITSFRNAVASAFRKRGRYESRYAEASTDVAGGTETTIDTVCSDFTLRATRGEAESDDRDPVVDLLAERLLAGMNERDRELLTWIGERVPASAIAAWRGTTPNAIKVRVSRLRARLRAEATAYLEELEGESREALLRFLRRGGVVVAPPPVVKTVVHPGVMYPSGVSPTKEIVIDVGYLSPYDREEG